MHFSQVPRGGGEACVSRLLTQGTHFEKHCSHHNYPAPLFAFWSGEVGKKEDRDTVGSIKYRKGGGSKTHPHTAWRWGRGSLSVAGAGLGGRTGTQDCRLRPDVHFCSFAMITLGRDLRSSDV